MSILVGRTGGPIRDTRPPYDFCNTFSITDRFFGHFLRLKGEKTGQIPRPLTVEFEEDLLFIGRTGCHQEPEPPSNELGNRLTPTWSKPGGSSRTAMR